MHNRKLFQVKVWQAPKAVSGIVKLPASAWELEDAAEKIRMNPTQDHEVNLFWRADDFSYLNRSICGEQNLYEVNLLAERLSKLNEFEQILFEGRFTMAKEEIPKQNPPVADLINMTYELDSCHLIAEAEEDESLGKFYFDNDMLVNFPEIPDDLVKYVNFAEVGRASRITEHGVFTPAGYVVDDNWPNLPQEYAREKLAPPSPSASVVLEVRRGCFNESGDNSPTIRLELPITDGEAESLLHNPWEACGYHCEECAIPAFKEVLDGNRADLGELNTLAVCISETYVNGQLPKYKALLRVSICGDIGQAIELADRLDEYEFFPEQSHEEHYAQVWLYERLGADAAYLMDRNLSSLGYELLERDHAILSEYGTIRRLDRQPLLQPTEMQFPEMTI